MLAYLDRLYGYACSLMRDRENARDLVQTTVAKALAAKNTPHDESAYRAWLFTIMRNAFRDELRRCGDCAVSLEQLEDESLLWNKVQDQDVFSNDSMIITHLTVRSLLEKVSHDHREVITLVDILGFSYRECADVLHVPVGTVMSRISRARQRLFELMADGSPESMTSHAKGEGK